MEWRRLLLKTGIHLRKKLNVLLSSWYNLDPSSWRSDTVIAICFQMYFHRICQLFSITIWTRSTENNIPFRSLAKHIVPSKFWKIDLERRLGNPIITRSVWNTGKAWRPLINVRFGAAKVRLSQIWEYSVHCITLAKERKVTLVSSSYSNTSLCIYESCLACEHFISRL